MGAPSSKESGTLLIPKLGNLVIIFLKISSLSKGVNVFFFIISLPVALSPRTAGIVINHCAFLLEDRDTIFLMVKCVIASLLFLTRILDNPRDYLPDNPSSFTLNPVCPGTGLWEFS